MTAYTVRFEEIQIACMYTDTFQNILCVRRYYIQSWQVTLTVCLHFHVYVREYVLHVQNM
jgi:hypothetical protein